MQLLKCFSAIGRRCDEPETRSQWRRLEAMMLRCALITAVVVLFNASRTQGEPPLKAGDMVILECVCHKGGNCYLDGRTGDGTVGLAPKTGGDFSGTTWRVVKLEKGELGLECQGDVDGNRWLDGRTRDGTVGLAPKTGGDFSGTKWKMHDRGDCQIQLECMGDAEGPRWLEGVRGDTMVKLTRDKERSGTCWKVMKAE
jgi:hypothetical protein